MELCIFYEGPKDPDKEDKEDEEDERVVEYMWGEGEYADMDEADFFDMIG